MNEHLENLLSTRDHIRASFLRAAADYALHPHAKDARSKMLELSKRLEEIDLNTRRAESDARFVFEHMILRTETVKETEPESPVTPLEAQMLRNICENEFADGGPEYASTWSDCLDCGPCRISKSKHGGLIASLVKKGFVEANGEAIYIKPAGFEIWKSLSK